MVWLCSLVDSDASGYEPRYQALDQDTFSTYADAWRTTHENWIGLKPSEIGCSSGQPHYFPVCVGGYKLNNRGGLNNVTCSKVQCLSADATLNPEATLDCLPTLPDTIEYTPPMPTVDLAVDNEICHVPLEQQETLTFAPHYGMDMGLPPSFNPLQVVRLNFTGLVRGQTSNGQCGQIVEGAKIDVWQLDPLALDRFDNRTTRNERFNKEYETLFGGIKANLTNYDDWGKNGWAPTTKAPKELRDVSCRGYVESDNSGVYRFTTTVPPSHGPPRYVMIQVSAPGFETVTTRVYFSGDVRLQQLTTLGGLEESQALSSAALNDNMQVDSVSGANTPIIGVNDAAGYGGTHGDPTFSDNAFPGAIAEDPRVVTLQWKDALLGMNAGEIATGMKKGHFEANFDIVLQSKRPNVENKGNATDPATDVDGLWMDEDGGFVKVETQGNLFHAVEYPHAREWGAVSGVMAGDTVRGVNFIGSTSTSTSPTFSRGFNNLPDNVLASSESTGVVLHENPNSDSPMLAAQNTELTIRWSGGSGLSEFKWTKQFDVEKSASGYRYLRLDITRDTDPDPSVSVHDHDGTANDNTGQLRINEIEFYEGILAQRALPTAALKMSSPHWPEPQRVTCSSFTEQTYHCFRAFDGDSGNSSLAWRTKPVGSSEGPPKDGNPHYGTGDGSVLSQKQWVLFDLGPDNYIIPSALKIVCGADHPNRPRGCPRTFSLHGSVDNVHYDVLHEWDLFDYDNEYANGGQLFNFYWHAPHGRPNNVRCGTCDEGPGFVCSTDAYDGTCASRYCDAQGLCNMVPECPPGEYMDYRISSVGRKGMTCKQCQRGRYGGVKAMTSSACSGTCSAGYYCPAGSTSKTEKECGNSAVYCPKGSGKPISASAGRHTVYELDNHLRWTDSADSVGVGVGPPRVDGALLGAVWMNNENNENNENNITPTPAFVYNVSSDPANLPRNGNGTLANGSFVQYGWIDSGGNQLYPTRRTYEIMCQRGHYCQRGLQIQCPVGTYGNREGLQEDSCTDSCIAGEYCPVGSVTPTLCEKGYYCPTGLLRYPCPAGTYGARTGLNNRRCSGLCKQGYYCNSGSTSSKQMICAAGRYGSYGGLQDQECSGQCERGYYCPAGSTNATAVRCGSADSAGPILDLADPIGSAGAYHYCPLGSAAPVPVTKGYYTVDGEVTLRANQTICEPGFYCQKGIRIACPRGTYGSVYGLTNTDAEEGRNGSALFGFQSSTHYQCNGLCDPGYYCPYNSSSPTHEKCPPGRYGGVQGQVDAGCTDICPHGHYCPARTVIPYECPAGTYGNTTGLVSEECNPECAEGGCTANECEEGYYCPSGSVSPKQTECGGSHVYCPTGSDTPTDVTEGWYTVGPFPYENVITRSSQKLCPRGFYCIKGRKIFCPPGTYGVTEGLSTSLCSGLCKSGYYCPQGSYNETLHRCPAGRYGSSTGLFRSSCTGPCTAGYHCPEGSVSPTELECAIRTPATRLDSDVFKLAGRDTGYNSAFGEVQETQSQSQTQTQTQRDLDNNSVLVDVDSSGDSNYANDAQMYKQLRKPNGVYCPEGSANPLVVLPGYYTTGNTRTTRTAIVKCPNSSYCVDGVIRDCPAGRYGITERLHNEKCSGPCAAGYFCPAGSTSRNEYPCPIGRYGAIEGLKDSLCSGPCKRALDCPKGSISKFPAANKLDSNVY